MSGKIQLTPAELKSQAAEMSSLQSEYEALFSEINTTLNSTRNNWSGAIAGNFSGKMISARNSFSFITSALGIGAQAANSCADSFETIDSTLAKLCSKDSAFSSEMSKAIGDNQKTETVVTMDDYFARVTDAEYIKLCDWWGRASEGKSKEEAVAAFLNYIKNLPKNDPLRNLTKNQIQAYIKPSGLSAISITDGKGNALVIFAGTQGTDLNDFYTDFNVGILGVSSAQSKQANEIIDEISKNNSNIVVTGHSLGGYLATSVTLKNSSVSKCIAFDPPGRKDQLLQICTNYNQVSKITTYEAVGSPVSSVGKAVGKYVPVIVEPNLDWNVFAFHDPEKMYMALGGDRLVEGSWNYGGGGGSW